MIIPDWLARQTTARPDRPALFAPGVTWSFAELSQRADDLATRLVALGLRPGDRLAILAANCADYVALVHAAPRCGAVLVPLNTRLSPAELVFQAADSAAQLILTDTPNLGLAAQIPSPALGILSFDELWPSPPAPLPAGEGSPISPSPVGRGGRGVRASLTTIRNATERSPFFASQSERMSGTSAPQHGPSQITVRAQR